MPNANFTAFKGFIPIDARKVDQPHVVNGENFLLNADGIYSAFGSDIISYERFENPELIETFNIEDDNFIFTKGGIWGYDATADIYFPKFLFTDAGDTAPWSEAFVGNVYFFAKKGVGLLSFNPTLNEWKNLGGTGSVPVNIEYITNASGRLIAVDPTIFYWSAFDDGEDFVTSTVTGAGAQSLGLVKNGTPLGVKHTERGGFLVLTDKGMIVADFIGTTIPFSFKTLTEHTKPISAFAILDVEDVIIILGEDGFWQTTGEKPTPWQPLMSEFFRQTLLLNILDTNAEAIRLHYNVERKWVLVSVAELNQPQLYTIAYVYYLPLDEWGKFNQRHHGFGTLNLQSGPFQGRNFGFISPDKYLRKFTDQPRIEPNPDQNELYHFHSEIEFDSRLEDGVHIASSFMYMPENDETFFATVGSSGLFTTTDGEPDGAYTPIFGSVDAFIDVGLFRFTEQLAVNEMSTVHEVAVGQDAEAVFAFDSEDWNIDSGDEDWNVLTAMEDWGFQVVSTVGYDGTIIGTVDGKNTWEDQIELMTKYDHTAVDSDGNTLEKLKTQYFSCYNTGIYHIIRLSAKQIDQSFFLKTLDINGNVDSVL